MGKAKEQQFWTKTVQIYQPFLEEQDIYINYDLNQKQIFQALKLEQEMEDSILKVEQETKITRNIVLGNPDKKAVLAQKLKQDKNWKDCFKNICEFFLPDLDPEEVVEDIDRPYWNNLQFGFLFDEYKSPNYFVSSNITHSFLAQLRESTKEKHKILKLQVVSLVSNVITADDNLCLGYRGGNSFFDVIMSVPAGSVEPHLKPGERGALFGSYDKELKEELALTPRDCKSSKLIARVEEGLTVPGGRQYYVFETKINMTRDELLEHWSKATDQAEHRHLLFYDINYPGILLSTIKYNAFDINEAGEKLNQTSLKNRGKILPQCSGPVLAYLTAKKGGDWAKKTQEYLGGHYDLTSFFKN